MSIISIICITIYIVSFAIGLGPIPFYLSSEMFPQVYDTPARYPFIRVVRNWVKFHILIYLSPLHECPIKEGFPTSWGRLKLKSFPRSVSSSIFCMDLLSAFNNARFKFQGTGSNTLEVMSICLNHIKLKKFQENL